MDILLNGFLKDLHTTFIKSPGQIFCFGCVRHLKNLVLFKTGFGLSDALVSILSVRFVLIGQQCSIDGQDCINKLLLIGHTIAHQRIICIDQWDLQFKISDGQFIVQVFNDRDLTKIMWHRQLCGCLDRIVVLDVQLVLIVCGHYCGHIVVRKLSGIIFPDIIIDSKEFVFLYAVVFYHKSILRRQVLGLQVILVFLHIDIFISQTVDGCLKAVIPVCFIRSGQLQCICKGFDVSL